MAKGAQEIDGQLTDDIDIYRTAKLYVDQHSDQAALQAAMQADTLLSVGDMEGSATWRRIAGASPRRPPGL